MTLPGKTWKDQKRKRHRVVKTTKATTKTKRLPKLQMKMRNVEKR